MSHSFIDLSTEYPETRMTFDDIDPCPTCPAMFFPLPDFERDVKTEEEES